MHRGPLFPASKRGPVPATGASVAWTSWKAEQPKRFPSRRPTWGKENLEKDGLAEAQESQGKEAQGLGVPTPEGCREGFGKSCLQGLSTVLALKFVFSKQQPAWPAGTCECPCVCLCVCAPRVSWTGVSPDLFCLCRSLPPYQIV